MNKRVTFDPTHREAAVAFNTANQQPNTLLIERYAADDKQADQSELNISIKNGVATLSGTSSSAANANMAEYLISRITGVDHVINLITNATQDHATPA